MDELRLYRVDYLAVLLYYTILDILLVMRSSYVKNETVTIYRHTKTYQI